jgi:DNA ligase-1
MIMAISLLQSTVFSYSQRVTMALLLNLFCASFFSTSIFAASPLMLANVYHLGIPLDDYFVSEKLDGVRGYWDGKKLYTREGNSINAPEWFTQGWPNYAMDGELWAGRGNFAYASSTVRKLVPDDMAWKKMRFMVFDLPAETGIFSERLAQLQKRFIKLSSPYLHRVEQTPIANHQALMKKMNAVVKMGGEGLMLHRGQSHYRAERNDDLLKVKPHDDAEARVIKSLPGKGKYSGLMGALVVETAEGLQFKIGTGFSDAERKNPPKIGSTITYRYRGLHDSGIPRFASFLRVRADND